MQITKQGEVYVAAHVTGPTHNCLKLKIRPDLSDEPPVVRVLPSIGDYQDQERLTADEILPSILAGVDRANTALGTNFSVEYAEIIENDSRRPSIYEQLSERIVEQAAVDLK